MLSGGFDFWMSFFDLALDELDAPDAGAAELGFPVGAALDGPEAADVAFQWWGVHEAAELVQDLRNSIV